MKVKDIIEKLQRLDPEMEVYVPSKLTEFDYCVSQGVSAKTLTIEESEDYPDGTCVIVIDEC